MAKKSDKLKKAEQGISDSKNTKRNIKAQERANKIIKKVTSKTNNSAPVEVYEKSTVNSSTGKNIRTDAEKRAMMVANARMFKSQLSNPKNINTVSSSNMASPEQVANSATKVKKPVKVKKAVEVKKAVKVEVSPSEAKNIVNVKSKKEIKDKIKEIKKRPKKDPKKDKNSPAEEHPVKNTRNTRKNTYNTEASNKLGESRTSQQDRIKLLRAEKRNVNKEIGKYNRSL